MIPEDIAMARFPLVQWLRVISTSGCNTVESVSNPFRADYSINPDLSPIEYEPTAFGWIPVTFPMKYLSHDQIILKYHEYQMATHPIQ
jgi:hypothetical protein